MFLAKADKEAGEDERRQTVGVTEGNITVFPARP